MSSAPLLMLTASLRFAVLGVCVNFAPVLAGMALIVGAGLYSTLLRSHEQHDSPDTRSPRNES